ncbi:MAG TPA: sigma-70 family RNA polymerase sigma factor [Thermomicrobiales bacterium]|nr:sigma-70 family RNA polymerase sigma factor [Thermomicrobiales bacterium]
MVQRSHLTADPDGSSLHDLISVRIVSSLLAGRPRHLAPARARSLLPVIGADDVILPAFDDMLGDLAIRAQEGDQEARDALYAAFLPKLTRLMSPVRTPFAPPGSQGIWNRDDVAQEAYLVFVELIEAWSGDVSFTAYVLSRFPWRLKDVIRRGIGKSPVPPRQYGVPMEHAEPVADQEGNAEGVNAMLDALQEVLPEPLGVVLIAHVVHGMTKTEIAAELGVSRRTMVRYWQEIRVYTNCLLRDDARTGTDEPRSRRRRGR